MSPDDSGTDGEGEAPVLDAAVLRASMDGAIASYRRGQSRDWLEQCLLYQKEHGTQTCPRQEGHRERGSAI